jgi:hypothetical protein
MDHQSSAEQINVFGHTDAGDTGFSSPADFVTYIREGIFRECEGRYRHNQRRNANVIVLSYQGHLYGHFEVDVRVEPTDADREEYQPVAAVYLVRRSCVYETPVAVADVGITGINYGPAISQEQFQAIRQHAGTITPYTASPNATA